MVSVLSQRVLLFFAVCAQISKLVALPFYAAFAAALGSLMEMPLSISALRDYAENDRHEVLEFWHSFKAKK